MENFAQFIGRFHPLWVHLPIGILMVAILFDWLSKNSRFTNLKPAIGLLYLLGGVSAAFSCITGYLLSTGGEYEGGTVIQHQWMGIGVTLLAFIFYGLYRYSLSPKGLIAKFSAILFVGLISWTGHLGGSLTHGEDYLFVHMPQPFKGWFIGPEEEVVVIEDVQEAKIYEDIVVPILKNNCYKCHSDKKQKGKLRLDSPEFIAKGGKSNALIVEAGIPDKSELIRRLLLPSNDEKHMPPKKKDELSKEEIALLEWWVQHGATYDKKVKEYPQTEEISSVLLALEQPIEIESTPEPEFPVIDLPPPPIESIKALQEAQVVVLPVGDASQNIFSVNFVNVNTIDANKMNLLHPINDHIVWLRMSDAVLNDSLMQYIQQMPNLTKLYLDNTQITDQGLAKLTNLKQLKYLNVVETKLTIAGLKQLKALPKLEQLFIYQTQTSAEERKQLVNFFQPVEIDTGGYKVPIFASDTTFLDQ